MNYMITIAKETVGLTGYRTYKKIETLPRHIALKKIEGKEIIRRFPNPFDASIEIVVVK